MRYVLDVGRWVGTSGGKVWGIRKFNCPHQKDSNKAQNTKPPQQQQPQQQHNRIQKTKTIKYNVEYLIGIRRKNER
jgi:hypothetical protein